jgi:hypothetical protein
VVVFPVATTASMRSRLQCTGSSSRISARSKGRSMRMQPELNARSLFSKSSFDGVSWR